MKFSLLFELFRESENCWPQAHLSVKPQAALTVFAIKHHFQLDPYSLPRDLREKGIADFLVYCLVDIVDNLEFEPSCEAKCPKDPQRVIQEGLKRR